MQKLLVLYFVGLFIFAGLILVVDKAEREQRSEITADKNRTHSNGSTTTDEFRMPSDRIMALDEASGSSNRTTATDELHASDRTGSDESSSPSEQATVVQEPSARPDTGAADDENPPTGRQREANDRGTTEDGGRLHPDEGERTVFEHERRAFEQPYLELGFKSVPDAIRDCEMRYMQKIYLPFYTPPVGFTHQLAICSTHYNDRDYLEINYLHETRPDYRYMILMRPSKYGIKVPESRVVRTYALNDGTPALLSLTPEEGYLVLTFDRWGWQYMLVVPKKLESVFPPDEMVKVANSVQSGYPRRVAWRY